MKKIFLSILIALTLGSTTVHARGMRCGTDIISDSGRQGPYKYEVLKKCGEPTSRESHNTWIYDRGNHNSKNLKVLQFDDRGMLLRIYN